MFLAFEDGRGSKMSNDKSFNLVNISSITAANIIYKKFTDEDFNNFLNNSNIEVLQDFANFELDINAKHYKKGFDKKEIKALQDIIKEQDIVKQFKLGYVEKASYIIEIIHSFFTSAIGIALGVVGFFSVSSKLISSLLTLLVVFSSIPIALAAKKASDIYKKQDRTMMDDFISIKLENLILTKLHEKYERELKKRITKLNYIIQQIMTQKDYDYYQSNFFTYEDLFITEKGIGLLKKGIKSKFKSNNANLKKLVKNINEIKVETKTPRKMLNEFYEEKIYKPENTSPDKKLLRDLPSFVNYQKPYKPFTFRQWYKENKLQFIKESIPSFIGLWGGNLIIPEIITIVGHTSFGFGFLAPVIGFMSTPIGAITTLLTLLSLATIVFSLIMYRSYLNTKREHILNHLKDEQFTLKKTIDFNQCRLSHLQRIHEKLKEFCYKENISYKNRENNFDLIEQIKEETEEQPLAFTKQQEHLENITETITSKPKTSKNISGFFNKIGMKSDNLVPETAIIPSLVRT